MAELDPPRHRWRFAERFAKFGSRPLTKRNLVPNSPVIVLLILICWQITSKLSRKIYNQIFPFGHNFCIFEELKLKRRPEKFVVSMEALGVVWAEARRGARCLKFGLDDPEYLNENNKEIIWKLWTYLDYNFSAYSSTLWQFPAFSWDENFSAETQKLDRVRTSPWLAAFQHNESTETIRLALTWYALSLGLLRA